MELFAHLTHYNAYSQNSQDISVLYIYLNYYLSAFVVKFNRVMILITLNVQNLLDSKKKTRYWLVKHMESNYETVNRICDNRTVALQLETIEKLCTLLECTPNDLFIIQK